VHAPRIAGTCHRRRMPTARGGQGGTTEGAAGRPTLGASCCARLLPSLCLLLSLRPAGGPIMLAPPSARTSCWHHALRARARTEAGGRSTRGMSTRGKSTCERVAALRIPRGHVSRLLLQPVYVGRTDVLDIGYRPSYACRQAPVRQCAKGCARRGGGGRGVGQRHGWVHGHGGAVLGKS
jgi:hypothetical protein